MGAAEIQHGQIISIGRGLRGVTPKTTDVQLPWDNEVDRDLVAER
jgi:hypothetical protein